MDRSPFLRQERGAAGHLARISCVALCASLLVTATAAAQASRTDRPYNITFQTAGQSMWGPGTTPLSGADATFTFADVSWDVSGTTRGVIDVAGFDFGANIGVDLDQRLADVRVLLSADARARFDALEKPRLVPVPVFAEPPKQ